MLDETLRQPLPGGETPDPMELFQDTFKEFTDDMMPYILAGLGQMVVMIPVFFIMIFVIYFAMFGTLLGGVFIGAVAGAVVGSVAGDDAGGLVFMLVYILSFFVMFAVIFGLSAVLGALCAPLNASLMRRVAKHQRGEEELDFAATFSDAKENLIPTMTVTALVAVAVMIGMVFCYIPGILLAFTMMYAGSLVYLHRESPVSAMKTSGKHFMANLQFHGLYSLLYFGAAMFAAYIPVLGPMYLLALHVRAHRTIFGDGEAAVLEPKILEA